MSEPERRAPRMLIVDDDPSIVASLGERFGARGFEIATATSGNSARPLLLQNPDIVLCDLEMPDGDGFSVLGAAADAGIDTTLIVITAYGTIERAVEAMRQGAYDFIQKPFDTALIEETVRRALERHTLVRSNRALRAAVDAPGVIASDPKTEAQLELARKAAVSDASILLLGESGTGKEVLARLIHGWSGRRDGPLVAFNCAAITDTLLESELFGHEKGAFTGATSRRPGKLEVAHGGTLFLDEIGDVSPAFQTKLLRALQERCFERVGGTDSIEVDVRFIAATNRDLKAAVERGEFREDLFYRLNVISIELPPLRERRGDVLPLAEHFVAMLARDAKVGEVAITGDARAALGRYPWPGNVRELRNVIERALVLCEDEISLADLPPELSVDPGLDDRQAGFHAQVEQYRKRLIRDALRDHDGHRTKAAAALGLQRTYLARLIRQYGLQAE